MVATTNTGTEFPAFGPGLPKLNPRSVSGDCQEKVACRLSASRGKSKKEENQNIVNMSASVLLPKVQPISM